MNDTFLKGLLYSFAASAGISFVYWLSYLVRENRKKDKEIAVKDYQIEKNLLKGEIDDSSILDVVRRANKRRGSDH